MTGNTTRSVKDATNSTITSGSDIDELPEVTLVEYLGQIFSDQPTLFHDNRLLRLSTDDSGVLTYELIDSINRDRELFIAGLYEQPVGDRLHRHARVLCPRDDFGTFINADFNTDDDHTDFYPRLIDIDRDPGESIPGGYIRVDGRPDALHEAVGYALDNGIAVAARAKTLAEGLDVPKPLESVSPSESDDDADSDSSDTTDSGHSHPGGVVEVDGEYCCNAQDCTYTGEFKEVRSHIGGKVARGDDTHTDLNFSL